TPPSRAPRAASARSGRPWLPPAGMNCWWRAPSTAGAITRARPPGRPLFEYTIMPRRSPHPNSSPLVLTIDIGSSSLRTNLYTAQAERLARYEAHLPYEVQLTADGGVEIDP